MPSIWQILTLPFPYTHFATCSCSAFMPGSESTLVWPLGVQELFAFQKTYWTGLIFLRASNTPVGNLGIPIALMDNFIRSLRLAITPFSPLSLHLCMRYTLSSWFRVVLNYTWILRSCRLVHQYRSPWFIQGEWSKTAVQMKSLSSAVILLCLIYFIDDWWSGNLWKQKSPCHELNKSVREVKVKDLPRLVYPVGYIKNSCTTSGVL